MARRVVSIRGAVLADADLPWVLAVAAATCPPSGQLGAFCVYERAYGLADSTRPAALPNLWVRVECDPQGRALDDQAEVEFLSQYDRQLSAPLEGGTMHSASVCVADALPLLQQLLGRPRPFYERRRRGYRFRYRTGELSEIFWLERLREAGKPWCGAHRVAQSHWVVSVQAVVSGGGMQAAAAEVAQRVRQRLQQWAPAMMPLPRSLDAPKDGWLSLRQEAGGADDVME